MTQRFLGKEGRQVTSPNSAIQLAAGDISRGPKVVTDDENTKAEIFQSQTLVQNI